MTDTAKDNRQTVGRKAVYWAVMLALLFVVFELFSSVALLYGYRFIARDSADAIEREVSSLSSVNLVYEVARLAGIRLDRSAGFQKYRKETRPAPFLVAEARMGYVASPGEYLHTYYSRRSAASDWSGLQVKVTINEDGSRWTGSPTDESTSSVYILGDSFVFGSGVSDEHTFAYLLQQARPDLRVKLLALGGYGLAHAYLRFEELKDELSEDDIVVLGYADFFDKRNVVAPSYLRSINDWIARRDPDSLGRNFSWPRVALGGDGEIGISYVPEDCASNNGYCEGDDPSREEMVRTSAALINYISDNSPAKVYVLHVAGDSSNPVFGMIGDTSLVSALSSDFDYFVRDDIEGFDPHPGPYWHYAISRRLLQVLSDR